jgi:hypothetical protein
MKKTTALDKIAIFLFFTLLTIATLCFGNKQVSNDKNKIHVSPYELVSFTAKQISDKNYITWCVISAQQNYFFVLERSLDGENYSIIELKKGFSSFGKQLQYSFIDSEPQFSEKIYYRIKLHEIQAADPENKKAVLSKENMFEQCKIASVAISNEQNSVSQSVKTNN